MSIALMTSAWRVNLPAPQKLVLLALCDWANDSGGSLHPSIRALAERCSISERQTQRLMRALMADGWIKVVGNFRGGKPGETRHYQLNVHAIEGDSRRVTNRAETGDKSGTGRVTNAVETGDKSGIRRVTNRAETGDTGVTLTVSKATVSKATLKEEQRTSARHVSPDKPKDVSDQTWDDWLTLRRAKKAPVTVTVLRQAETEAAKAEMTLESFLALWCARGSQGLQAAWIAPHEKNSSRPKPPAGQRPSAAQDFRGKSYVGTPIDDLPPDLRDAARAAIAAC